MNCVGTGSRTLQNLVVAYAGTSEPPFLGLEDSSVFLGAENKKKRRKATKQK